jgi:hypothetical protein
MPIKTYSTSGTYIDGTLNLSKNNFDVGLFVNNEHLAVTSFSYSLQIPINKLISCNLRTDQEITETVTLGRLLVFGIFAFGMKKPKKIITKYIVINFYDESDKQQMVIIECPRYSSFFIDKVRECMDNYNNQLKESI